MAKEGFKTGRTIREMALEKGIPAEKLDELLDPAKMTEPGLGGGPGSGTSSGSGNSAIFP